LKNNLNYATILLMDTDNIQVNVEEVKLKAITEEFHQGIETVQKFNPSVTFYGSTRITENHPYYKKVQNLTNRIAKELEYAILSGGGPGIMEAANRGAFEAGGKSVGLTIKLPFEQVTNPYVTDEIPFHFFFTRQAAMSYSTEVCVFCPGGFGTLNELFENLTLQQTGKIGKIPVILFGSDFWNPIDKMIKENLLERYQTVSKEDMRLYTIEDDENVIMEIIKNSAMRSGLDSLK
jgi:uncharacterized protein (TIGR00730 family)